MKKKREDQIEITTGEYVNLHYTCAQPGSRVFAVVIDWLVSWFMFYGILESETFFRGIPYPIRDYIIVTSIVLVTMFHFMCEYFFNGKSIGKMLMKIKVISEECTPPDFLQCFLRFILFFPVDFFVGIIFMAKKNQRLGDLASGCYVVYDNSYKDTKIDLDKDFPYAEDSYTVQYPFAESFTKEEVISIQKVIYNSRYKSLKPEMCKRIKRRFPKERFWGSEDVWLKKLVMDYHYLKKE